ncbi:MAG: phosphodiester glycosidase family protein [Clostridia bacterium]|nr:phosphodiester glycosidase family protein [Clostridia bacterium]
MGVRIVTKKKIVIPIICSVLAVLFLLCGIVCVIMQTDRYDYVGEKVYKGVYYDEQQITLTDGKVTNTFVLTISSLSKNLQVVTGVPDDLTPLEPGLVQTPYNQAISAEMNEKYVIAAINADYFYMNKDDRIQPCSVTIKDGKLLTEFYKSRWDRGCFFGIKNDGSAVLGDEAVYNEVKSELYQAVGGGPWLIKEGVAAPFEEDGGRHPRTAIGILENGSVLMMVADGRSEESAGFSYKELTDYMFSLGCVEAINLDGGGSSNLILKDFEYEFFESRNQPSDGTERPVGNTLLVIDKSKKPQNS